MEISRVNTLLAITVEEKATLHSNVGEDPMQNVPYAIRLDMKHQFAKKNLSSKKLKPKLQIKRMKIGKDLEFAASSA